MKIASLVMEDGTSITRFGRIALIVVKMYTSISWHREQ